MGLAGSCPSPGAGPGFAPDLLLPLPCLFAPTRREESYAQGKEDSTHSRGFFILADGDRLPKYIPVQKWHLGQDTPGARLSWLVSTR